MRLRWCSAIAEETGLVLVPLMAGGAPTAPPRAAARSVPTRRTDRSNQRAALHQAAEGFCRTRLVKLAFRGLRSTAALASTNTTQADQNGKSTTCCG